MGVVVFGSTLYGKVESVPGICHVATRFLHVFFVPLFPTGSWLVIDDDALQQVGGDAVRLPSMHWRSVGVAWLRFFLLVATFVLGIIAATKLALDRPLTQTLPLTALGVACVAAFLGSYRLTRASLQSVESLRSVSGIPSAVLARASERLR